MNKDKHNLTDMHIKKKAAWLNNSVQGLLDIIFFVQFVQIPILVLKAWKNILLKIWLYSMFLEMISESLTELKDGIWFIFHSVLCQK